MPTFEIVSVGEVGRGTTRGKRAELLQECIGYMQRVPSEQAGVLKIDEGETTQAIRRRLTAASEALGKSFERLQVLPGLAAYSGRFVQRIGHCGDLVGHSELSAPCGRDGLRTTSTVRKANRG